MRGFITLDELKKMSHLFSNSINCKFLYKMEWDLKRILNFIKSINNNIIKNKYNLIE